MKSLQNLIELGGPVMILIMALSILLYTQCFNLLITLRRCRRSLEVQPSDFPEQATVLQATHDVIYQDFQHQRLTLGAMIAAAPLLGLLGTVSGMSRTFESLSSHLGDRSMGNLAGGISEVLIATESGLAVAIPALLIVYLAHREIDKYKQKLNQLKVHAGWSNPS